MRLVGEAADAGAEIAQRLSLSPKTVSTYRTRILQKMRLRSDAALLRYMLQAGLTH